MHSLAQFTVPAIADISDAPLTARLQHLLDNKTKPLGSLGRLESLALRIGQVLGTEAPALLQPQMLVCAGDHGLAAKGVSAFPSDVTWQMVENFLAGGAAVSVLARQHGLALTVVDCGVAKPIAPRDTAPGAPQLLLRKVAPGTADASVGPAMTAEQCAQAITNGIEVVRALPGNALLLGEMGIANTSVASLLLARLAGPLLRRLFPEVPQGHPAQGAMTMNISANLLGLDNAATPLGLKAMRELQSLNTAPAGTASHAQIMFVVMNTAGLTLIPTSVIAIRQSVALKQGLGADFNAADIFLPTLLVTFISLLAGVLASQWMATTTRDLGEVFIRFAGYDLHTNVPRALLSLLLVVAVLWVAWRLLSLPFRAWSRHRRKQARARLIDGLDALHAGHWRTSPSSSCSRRAFRPPMARRWCN